MDDPLPAAAVEVEEESLAAALGLQALGELGRRHRAQWGWQHPHGATLVARSRLVQHPPDPLGRHLAARAEGLRELADPQLLEQPRHLAQLAGSGGRRPALEARGGRARSSSWTTRMRSRSTAARVGQPLQPPGGAAQVALDVGAAGRAGRGDEAREARAGRAARATSARARLQRRRRCSGSSARSTSRAASRIRTTCADDPRRRVGQAARRRGRAAARSPPRPTPGRPPRPSARRAPPSTRVLEHRARRCRAARAASASCGALPSRSLDARARGEGIVSAQQPARAGAHRGALRLRASRAARTPDASRPRRRAPGTRARPGRCRAARPSCGSVAERPGASGPCARARAAAAVSSARSCGRTRSRSASRSLPAASTLRRARPRRGSVIRRCGGQPREVPGVARDAHAAQRLELARASASSSGPLARLEPREHLRGDLRDRHERARSSFGSERISAVTSSCAQRRARASRSRRRAAAPSAFSGTCDGHAVVVGARARSGS